MNRFEAKLSSHGFALRRARLQTLQINVGRKCNRACRHCHVDEGPWRTEMISQTTMHRIGEWIGRFQAEIVDLTGGDPELSEFFRFFVETSRAAGSHVIDRCNLTIIEEPGYGDLPLIWPDTKSRSLRHCCVTLPRTLPGNTAQVCSRKVFPPCAS